MLSTTPRQQNWKNVSWDHAKMKGSTNEQWSVTTFVHSVLDTSAVWFRMIVFASHYTTCCEGEKRIVLQKRSQLKWRNVCLHVFIDILCYSLCVIFFVLDDSTLLDLALGAVVEDSKIPSHRRCAYCSIFWIGRRRRFWTLSEIVRFVAALFNERWEANPRTFRSTFLGPKFHFFWIRSHWP